MTEAARRETGLGVVLGTAASAAAVAPVWGKAAAAGLVVTVAASAWVARARSRWIAAFCACALLLPPLPGPVGDTGPHVAPFVALLGLLMGAAQFSDWRVRATRLNATLLCLFAALAGSVAMAAFYNGPAIAAASAARVLLFGISVYLFFYQAEGPGAEDGVAPFARVRLLFGLAAVSAAFACVDFYFHFPAPAGFGAQYVWLDSGVYRRAQGIFYEASTLGNFCAFFLVMIAVALTRPRKESPVPRWALAAGGLFFAGALAFSYSRGSVVTVGVALAVLMVLHRRRFGMLRVAAILTAAGAAAVFLMPSFAGYWWSRMSGSAQFLVSLPEDVLSGRLASWRILMGYLGEHPWRALLGIGYKTLPYAGLPGESSVVADNMYLGMLVETGIAGLAALAAFHLAALRAAWKASRSADRQRSFLGDWFLCFWAGEMVQMLSGDLLTYWRVLPVYFWVLALAVREWQGERPVSGPVR